MLSRLALVLSVATLSLTARPADACSPEPGCGDEICSYATAFIDADITTISSDGHMVTMVPKAIFGEAPGLTVGIEATVKTYGFAVPATEAGQQRFIYLRPLDNELSSAASWIRQIRRTPNASVRKRRRPPSPRRSSSPTATCN
jgi:hypothetical protein